MDKFLAALVFSLIFLGCNSPGASHEEDPTLEQDHTEQVSEPVQQARETVQDTVNAPKIEWAEEVYSFGVIHEGAEVKHTYNFTNTGKTPLIISDVKASCGCTTPEFTTDPVKPGETGSITVVFDSSGQRGKQQKIISVLSNAHPQVSMVQLKGEVKEST